MIRERQWLSSTPACNSLFACLYMQDARLVRTPELATLLAGALQTASVIHKAIVQADCYEDVSWRLFLVSSPWCARRRLCLSRASVAPV